tara:strand:- start:409 stop:666 length:258 start_codon:yes stop_codon:yes gene_type:complete
MGINPDKIKKWHLNTIQTIVGILMGLLLNIWGVSLAKIFLLYVLVVVVNIATYIKGISRGVILTTIDDSKFMGILLDEIKKGPKA